MTEPLSSAKKRLRCNLSAYSDYYFFSWVDVLTGRTISFQFSGYEWEQRPMCESENERWGRFTEWVARIAFRLSEDRGTFHDAMTEDGVPVEVKGCIRRTSRGDPGKFFIREANHRELRDADGFYVFVVYDPQNWKQGPVLDVEMKPATWLDGVDYGWTGNGDRRGEVVKRPPWTTVFPPEDIPGEGAEATRASA